MGGSTSAFTEECLIYGRECFVGADINNQSKLLSDSNHNDNFNSS